MQHLQAAVKPLDRRLRILGKGLEPVASCTKITKWYHGCLPKTGPKRAPKLLNNLTI